MNGKRSIRALRATCAMRSQRGASLPLALLLFLICALLASVVLSASTTAAGRHAQLSSMDQRYYSVTSAANLVRDAFQSQQVEIECTEVRDASTVVTYVSGGTINRTETIGDVKSFALSVDGKQVMAASSEDGDAALDTSSLTLPELCALYALLGGQRTGAVSVAEVWDAAALDALDAASTTSLGTYDVAASVSSASSGASAADIESALAAVMTARLADGALELQFDSVAESAAADIYSLTLVCDADFDADEWTDEELAADQPAGTTTTRVENSTQTTTRSVVVSWVPSALYKTGTVA